LATLGLVPPPGQVSGGRILIDGIDLAQLPEKQRAELRGSKIALVSQEPMVALDPCFTIGSQLREPLRLHRKLTRSQADQEALNLLRLVGIARPESVAKSFPHQISGGMAQRVAIAIALTGEPELLIADEPTTALDVTIQAEILDLLRSLQDKLGMTVVIVTHDLGVVADFCQTVAVMYAGQVIEVGAVEDVLVRPAHPYTRALLGAVPDVTRPGQALATVKGTVPLPKDWPAWCRFADRCEFAVAACRSRPIPLDALQPDRAARCIRATELLGAQR
jgi:peptide/nickel transport system permease protein